MREWVSNGERVREKEKEERGKENLDRLSFEKSYLFWAVSLEANLNERKSLNRWKKKGEGGGYERGESKIDGK